MTAISPTNYKKAQGLITSLFFIWGFLTCMNDILSPYLKQAFDLSFFQSNLVQFAFFGAYFIGSVIFYVASLKGYDLIQKIGYKKGMMLGLLISALGSFIFYPAASLVSFGLFLFGLFLIGLGFTLLQICANPYVALLGAPEGAASRLNLAQAFNSLGTTLAPLIGGFLIFNFFNSDYQTAAAKLSYLYFGIALVIVSILVKIVQLPAVKTDAINNQVKSALDFPQLKLGIVAIFMYVGAEVAIGTNLISYLGLPEIAGLEEAVASTYLAYYWGGLMTGRFLGAISVGDDPTHLKLKKMILALVGSTALICFATYVKTGELALNDYLLFTAFSVVGFIGFLIGKYSPNRTLTVFSAISILLLLFGVFLEGTIAMWCMLAIGLFNSIMWSNIFTIAINGLGASTSQGSSLLVMAIVGGAIFPPLQGALADGVGIKLSFLLPILAYVYIAYYGRITGKQ